MVTNSLGPVRQIIEWGEGGGWRGNRAERITFSKKGRGIGALVLISIFQFFKDQKLLSPHEQWSTWTRELWLESVYKRVFRDTQIVVTNISHSWSLAWSKRRRKLTDISFVFFWRALFLLTKITDVDRWRVHRDVFVLRYRWEISPLCS